MALTFIDNQGRSFEFNDQQEPLIVRINNEKGALKKLVAALQEELRIIKEEKAQVDRYVDETVEHLLLL